MLQGPHPEIAIDHMELPVERAQATSTDMQTSLPGRETPSLVDPDLLWSVVPLTDSEPLQQHRQPLNLA